MNNKNLGRPGWPCFIFNASLFTKARTVSLLLIIGALPPGGGRERGEQRRGGRSGLECRNVPPPFGSPQRSWNSSGVSGQRQALLVRCLDRPGKDALKQESPWWEEKISPTPPWFSRKEGWSQLWKVRQILFSASLILFKGKKQRQNKGEHCSRTSTFSGLILGG